MPRTSGQTGSGTNPSGAQKYPKGTKWAYFKKLPPGITTGNGKNAGWVRVGSVNWNKIQHYNSTAKTTLMRGSGDTRGSGDRRQVYHPSRKATQQWNPSSPRGQIILNNGSTASDGSRNPGVDPGRGGEQGARRNGTAGDQTPGGDRNPGNRTGNGDGNGDGNGNGDQSKQEKAWSKFMGNPNTQTMIPLKDAAAQAGLQYDGQIKDARVSKADQIAQAGQNLADIKTWYTHLLNQNAGAITANDAAVHHETAANQADLMAGLSAIGGSANDSASSVLSQGLQANRFARQMGQNQDDYYNAQTTALGQNRDAELMAQKALDSQTSQSLDSNLQNLIGQKGQAITTAQMAIIAANNAARQGNFGNRISKAQSIAGLLQLGLNAKISAAQLRQMGGGGGAHPGFIKFSSQTPAQQQQTLTMLLQGGKDANGNPIAIPLVEAARRAKIAGYDAAPGSSLWKLLATYTH